MIFWYAFPADSSKMDPTKIEKSLHHFIFLLPPDSSHISRTTGPSEMVHLSIFIELNKEYHYSGLEMAVQTIIVQRLSENWVLDSLLLFSDRVLSSNARLKK